MIIMSNKTSIPFILITGLIFIVNNVSGHCDTLSIQTSPNLKFLKVVTAGAYQVRKSDREVRDGQEVYLYCSDKKFLYDDVKPSKVTCENSIFNRNLPLCYSEWTFLLRFIYLFHLKVLIFDDLMFVYFVK